MNIEYDVPFEVSATQYKAVMKHCAGIVAGRQENGKYFIKVWMMKYAEFVKGYLKSYAP